ncbi:TPA: hypothetical protein DCQ44_03200 [Candidatus Taylorbacteria bacterium]|nr:hypothetical protein [Candidatus Taylorbacteria bacterium]
MSKVLYLTGLLCPEIITGLENELVWCKRKNIKNIKVCVHHTQECDDGIGEAMLFYAASKDPQFKLPVFETLAGPGVSTSGLFIFLAGQERKITTNVSFRIAWNILVIKTLVTESGLQQTEIRKILQVGMPMNAFRVRQLELHTGMFMGPIETLTPLMARET